MLFEFLNICQNKLLSVSPYPAKTYTWHMSDFLTFISRTYFQTKCIAPNQLLLTFVIFSLKTKCVQNKHNVSDKDLLYEITWGPLISRLILHLFFQFLINKMNFKPNKKIT